MPVGSGHGSQSSARPAGSLRGYNIHCHLDVERFTFSVRVGEKKQDTGDRFFKRMDVLLRMENVDQFSQNDLYNFVCWNMYSISE